MSNSAPPTQVHARVDRAPEGQLPRTLDAAFEGLAWLILACTPLLINVYNVDAYRTVQATFASILVAVAVGVWAVARSLERSWSEVGRVPVLYPLAAFAIWTLMTVPRSPSPSLGLASWWNLATYFGFWIALSDVTARHARMRYRLVVPMFVGFIANVVIGLMQYQHVAFMEIFKAFPQQPWIANYFAGLDAPAKLGSAAGMLGNQNVLGDYLVGFIPLCLYLGAALLANRKRWGFGVGLLVSGVLGIACLVATQTRGSYIGLAIGLLVSAVTALVYYGKQLRRLNAKTWLAVGLGIALVGGALVVKGHDIGLNRAIAKLHGVGTDNTSLQRINAWHVALTMANEKPLVGEGLATYKILYFRYLMKTFNGAPIPPNMHNRYVQAHNDFIQLAGETGYTGFLLGLVVLLGFSGGATWWILSKRSLDTTDRMLALSGVAGLLSISGSALFGFPFHIASSSVLAAGVAGLTGGLWTQARRAETANKVVLHTEGQIAIYTYAMPLAILLLTVAVVWSNWTPYQADKFTKQGQELYRIGRIPEAQLALDQAVRLDPERGDARLMLGLIDAIYNRFPQAAHELNEAERSYDDVTLHYYLGRVYESMNRPDMARDEYNTALHYFPSGMDITKAVSERLNVLDHPASASRPVAH